MTTSIYNTSYIIYKHTNTITGKSYIGKTVYGLELRWYQHCRDMNKYNAKFQYALRKHGIKCWTNEILYVSFEQDDKHLYEVEEQLISDWDTYHNGYNSDTGGDGVGSGNGHPMWGKIVSVTHRENISKAKRGKLLGIHSSKFIGFWVYDNIKYDSSVIMSKKLNIPKRVCVYWCKEYNLKKVHYSSYGRSKFLQSLGTKEEIVGKTFKELGFDFEPV